MSSLEIKTLNNPIPPPPKEASQKWRLFRKKEKIQKKPDLNLINQVETLLNSCGGEPSDIVIKKCEYFISLHRVMENTAARCRLEGWARKVILIYLIVVGAILILNVFSKPLLGYCISDNVMIVLLSTTTVNILGLGFIVLKGHFKVSETGIAQGKNEGIEYKEKAKSKGFPIVVTHEMHN